MSKWTKESLEARLSAYAEPEDPGSPQAKKRARILAAAADLFARQGYRKTSVDEIARAAHIAKGTVYLYFKDKVTLLVHVIAIEKRSILRRMEPLLSGEIPEKDRLRYYVEFAIKAMRDLPLSASLMRRDADLLAALDEMDAATRDEALSENEAWMVELIDWASGGAFDEAEKRRRANVLATINFVSWTFLDDRVRVGRSLDEFAATFADMLVYGAANPPPKK